MASSSSTHRRARDGNEYTAEEFKLFYGEERWEAIWDNAPTGDVAQLADVSATTVVRLRASDLIEVRQQEANRGPPRSLHNMARQALDAISQKETYAEVDLDDWFEWIPYVAANAESERIVGPGITQAVARFRAGTTDANRGGAPRLDFCFIRVDGTVCRVHPGRKRSQDAQLIFE